MKRRTGGRDSPAAASGGVAKLASACRSHAGEKVKCTAACRWPQPFFHWHSTMIVYIKLLWVLGVLIAARAASERATPSRSASEAALRRLYRPDLNTPSRSEPPMWSVTSVGAPLAAATACTSTRRPSQADRRPTVANANNFWWVKVIKGDG